MKSLLFFMVVSVALLSFGLQAHGSEGSSNDGDGTVFAKAGDVITLSESVKNPNNYPVQASIEFVFENKVGDNFWENKKHTGEAGANKNYGTHQAFFVQHVGRFYIHTIYEIDGKITERDVPTEFIVFEEYSKATLNGCGAKYEIVVKPDYSKAVCVFDDSVEKLAQRGWVTD